MSIKRIAVADIGGRPTKKMTLTIEGTEEAFDTLVNLLAAIQWAGAAGHSGKFGCYIDGDGADKIRIEGLPENLGGEMARATCAYGGDYEIFHATGAWCESGVRTEANPTGMKVTRVWPEANATEATAHPFDAAGLTKAATKPELDDNAPFDYERWKNSGKPPRKSNLTRTNKDGKLELVPRKPLEFKVPPLKKR